LGRTKEIAMTAFDHQTGSAIHVDGADIYFEVAGNEHGPPLLLLHGGLGTIEDFNPLLPYELSEEYRLVGVDSRGHGKSTLGSAPLTYERLERDVIVVLRHLGIEATAILGFSDGGVIGYRLMASGAINVSKLATIGAGHELRADDPVRPVLSRVTAESWLNRFPGTDELYRRLNPEPDFGRLVTAVVQMWLDTSPKGYPGDAIDRLTGALLVIRGDEDHLFSRRSAADLADRVKGAALAVIPFAGHAAHVDRPRMVAESLTEFLKRPVPAAH
jgi:pimeloyl-ACP methyl ester carboxylesterase